MPGEAMEVQRRGDLEWFKALEKRWENRPRAPPPKTASTTRNEEEYSRQLWQQQVQQQHRARLTAFYEQHNPAKLDSIDDTLHKFRGKEEELFAKLEQRYCKDDDDAYPSPPPFQPHEQDPQSSSLPMTNPSRPLCFMTFSTHPDFPVKIQLFADITPLAAENFRQLCRRPGTYCRSKIHRIVPGMCVQGGDYTTGDGTGGRSIYKLGERPGVDMWGKFPDDATFLAHNAPGLVSMANSGKNTNSSQFFFTLAPLKHLNGKHVVFGRVVQGLDVILSLGRQQTTNPATQRPVADIVIVDCGEIIMDRNGQETWIRASEQQQPFVKVDEDAAAASLGQPPPPVATPSAASSQFTFSNSSKTTTTAPFATQGAGVMATPPPYSGFGGAVSAGGLTFGSLAQRAGTTAVSTFGSVAPGSTPSPLLTQSSTSSAFSSFGAAAASSKPSIFGSATKSSAFGGHTTTAPAVFGSFTPSNAFINPAAAQTTASSFPPALSSGGDGGPTTSSLFGMPFNDVLDKTRAFRVAEVHDDDSETSENVQGDSDSGDEADSYDDDDDDDDDGSEYVDNRDEQDNSSSTGDNVIDDFHLDSGDDEDEDALVMTEQVVGRATRSQRADFQGRAEEHSSVVHPISDTVVGSGASTAVIDTSYEVAAMEAAVPPSSPPSLFRFSGSFPSQAENHPVEPKSETTMAVAPFIFTRPAVSTLDTTRGGSTGEHTTDAAVTTAIPNVSAPPPPLFGVAAAAANSTTSSKTFSESKSDFGKDTTVASSTSFRGMPPATTDDVCRQVLDTNDIIQDQMAAEDVAVLPPLASAPTTKDVKNAERTNANADDTIDEKADRPTLDAASSGQHLGQSLDGAKQDVPPGHDRHPGTGKIGAITEVPVEGSCAGSRPCVDSAPLDSVPVCTAKSSSVDVGERSADRWCLAQRDSAPKDLLKVPGEVVCGDDVFFDSLGDEPHLPLLESSDTMPRNNISAPSAQPPSKNISSRACKDRPPERIEFDTAERSCNVSVESQDPYTPNSSRIDDNDRLARQSEGEETVESDLVDSTVTVGSSVSGQVELLRRDIEISSLDISEALRRVERQRERVRSHQRTTSSLTNTPTHYSRSLLPPTPPASTKPDIHTRGINQDIDPAGRFVYLSRIANRFVKGDGVVGGRSVSSTSRRSFPDEVMLASTPPRRQSPTYRQPVLLDDADLEELQRESRSVQPLVEKFDKWTGDHVEKQKKERTSPVKLEPTANDSMGSSK